jgi:RHS repeat-associated protein
MVVEDGSWTARFVYDADGFRISTEFDYADGTNRGEGGENFASDIAAGDIQKVWYRSNYLGSSIIAVNVDGDVISHTIYDPWGNPLTATYSDANYSGIDNRSNYTGYSWDEVLGLYYSQARMYDSETHRFISEDLVRDGWNWYIYCTNNPIMNTDVNGLMSISNYSKPFFVHLAASITGSELATGVFINACAVEAAGIILDATGYGLPAGLIMNLLGVQIGAISWALDKYHAKTLFVLYLKIKYEIVIWEVFSLIFKKPIITHFKVDLQVLK